MNLSKVFLIILSILLLEINAQDNTFKNYKPIESSGIIPSEFVTKSSEVVKDELEDFIQDDKGKTKKYKKNFLISSTFGTKQVLLSGKVLFNDPVTKYINKVAKVIFDANEDLNSSEFRIYAYKSPIVNAMAFNDGLVLINLGLIAQLENEAQLALILSHEFSHYINKDGIEMYLESRNMDNGIGAYKNISYNDKMLYKSKYSQEIESNADLDGLVYYKKTKYSFKPVNGVFDVLKYSYLPFDDIVFDTTYFENKYYTFPSEYKLAKVNPISPDGMENEDEDEDILKSHPDAEDRREAALENITISEIKDKSRKVYLASSAKEFEKIRTICRFEMPRMYLLHGYYEMAFYNAFMLEEKGYTDNVYLEKIKAKAIGQMSRMINHGDRPSKSKIRRIEDDLQGESQQIYYFLNSLGRDKKEFNVFAVQYTYEILKKYPKDEELELMFDDVVFGMFDKTNLKYSNFKRIKQNIDNSTLDSTIVKLDKEEQLLKEKSEKEQLMDEIRNDDSKYNKIEKKVIKEAEIDEEEIEEKKTSKVDKDTYYKYAFAKYLNDKTFSKKLKSTEKRIKAEQEEVFSKADSKSNRINRKLNRSRGYALGIDKVTVVNPVFYTLSDGGAKVFKSERGQENLNDIIKKIDNRTKLNIEILDINNGEDLDTKKFNEATILDEWVSEQFLFDEPLNFSSIETEKIEKITKSFDSKYFLWTGVINIQNRKKTYFYNLLFDVEKSKVIFKSYRNVSLKLNKNIIKSELYHVFNQIQTKRKVK